MLLLLLLKTSCISESYGFDLKGSQNQFNHLILIKKSVCLESERGIFKCFL